ncbi:hypothetical protein EMIHUDRAFT_236745 [Emiliania huxleyi CCMP1516]|uniref:Uncharacterized protein n=2 Tax=Emiliania huxleyi TaxID=2903 RepID=A0A0D3JRZ1_EMIH1|nr:hypothetical protein EMIHUDRAFT_236745 [Emiliania huxleyi CCMP1516]EOD26276.1 hypothetical protein EMIHUDRAFT_236745 [Emiliania huxleyi CCMP1516]|eukprot:XP_005778705.1 hypothetical protein EMIHUDRAFT_236745 [Emiliania huxleyi CCMP1516]
MIGVRKKRNAAGMHGVFYNFLSAPGISLNLMIEEASFTLRKGALLAHLAARVTLAGAYRSASASLWASALGKGNWGWDVINGTCAGRPFKFGMMGRNECGDLTVLIHGNTVYNSVAGAKHRFDARDLPHGIVGQSFASNARREGRRDWYPLSGRFTTSAQAEGAIEGEAAMYQIASAYETHFAFSRFDAPITQPAARHSSRPDAITTAAALSDSSEDDESAR